MCLVSLPCSWTWTGSICSCVCRSLGRDPWCRISSNCQVLCVLDWQCMHSQPACSHHATLPTCFSSCASWSKPWLAVTCVLGCSQEKTLKSCVTYVYFAVQPGQKQPGEMPQLTSSYPLHHPVCCELLSDSILNVDDCTRIQTPSIQAVITRVSRTLAYPGQPRVGLFEPLQGPWTGSPTVLHSVLQVVSAPSPPCVFCWLLVTGLSHPSAAWTR